MSVDLSLMLRKEILIHFENDAILTGLVPAERIYGMSVPSQPVWPFIRYGTPINLGYEATCWNGMQSDVTIHAFTETSTTTAGEDEAMMISQAVVNSMAQLKPSTIALVDNTWTNGQILRDEAESDRFHAIIQFNITAVLRH